MSLFNYRVQKHSLYEDLCFNEFIQSLKEITFKEWYKNNYNNLRGGPVSCPQVFFLYNENEEIRMDFIGRFEKLQEYFNIIYDKIKIHNNNFHTKMLQNTNTTPNTTMKKQRKLLRKNMQRHWYFGYEFGE